MCIRDRPITEDLYHTMAKDLVIDDTLVNNYMLPPLVLQTRMSFGDNTVPCLLYPILNNIQKKKTRKIKDKINTYFFSSCLLG